MLLSPPSVGFVLMYFTMFYLQIKILITSLLYHFPSAPILQVPPLPPVVLITTCLIGGREEITDIFRVRAVSSQSFPATSYIVKRSHIPLYRCWYNLLSVVVGFFPPKPRKKSIWCSLMRPIFLSLVAGKPWKFCMSATPLSFLEHYLFF